MSCPSLLSCSTSVVPTLPQPTMIIFNPFFAGLLFPGWIKTDLYKRAEIGARKATTRYVGMVTPDKVAKKALKDAKKGKDISIYSLFTKISHVAAKLLPQRIMMKIWLKQQ